MPKKKKISVKEELEKLAEAKYECLIRNEAYLSFWENFKKNPEKYKEMVYNPPMLEGESEKEWIERVKKGNARPLIRIKCDEFGIRHPVSPHNRPKILSRYFSNPANVYQIPTRRLNELGYKFGDNIIILAIDKTANKKYIRDRINNYIWKDFDERRDHIDKIPLYLEVWDLRRSRKKFKEIARELGINENTAKKRYYRAYEEIYGKPYDPAYYEQPEIKKEYLKRECSTCQEKPTCTVLCPDIIAYVEQDSMTYQRETILKSGGKKQTETLDYLSEKSKASRG